MFVMHSGYFCVELNIFIHFVGVRHKQSNIVEEFFCVGVEAVCVFLIFPAYEKGKFLEKNILGLQIYVLM